jgi:hypothetical protein
MEIHKPIEKEKGITERGNNNARMRRVLHETSGRRKENRKAGTDDARGNRRRQRKQKSQQKRSRDK